MVEKTELTFNQKRILNNIKALKKANKLIKSVPFIQKPEIAMISLQVTADILDQISLEIIKNVK
jgi:hypothetical protein